jgi:serine phosphatase RsbU (regulator of sigma subunit)
MERRAASHTEEEEMNQRRRLLNAAKKGDQKAVAKLFELYQVRVYNNEMVSKLNRTAGTHKLQAEVAQAKAAAKGGGSSRKAMQKKSVPSSGRHHGKARSTRSDKKAHRKK